MIHLTFFSVIGVVLTNICPITLIIFEANITWLKKKIHERNCKEENVLNEITALTNNRLTANPSK